MYVFFSLSLSLSLSLLEICSFDKKDTTVYEQSNGVCVQSNFEVMNLQNASNHCSKSASRLASLDEVSSTFHCFEPFFSLLRT